MSDNLPLNDHLSSVGGDSTISSCPTILDSTNTIHHLRNGSFSLLEAEQDGAVVPGPHFRNKCLAPPWTPVPSNGDPTTSFRFCLERHLGPALKESSVLTGSLLHPFDDLDDDDSIGSLPILLDRNSIHRKLGKCGTVLWCRNTPTSLSADTSGDSTNTSPAVDIVGSSLSALKLNAKRKISEHFGVHCDDDGSLEDGSLQPTQCSTDDELSELGRDDSDCLVRLLEEDHDFGACRLNSLRVNHIPLWIEPSVMNDDADASSCLYTSFGTDPIGTDLIVSALSWEHRGASDVRGHLDAGSQATTMPHKHLISNYKPHSADFPCPIRLISANDSPQLPAGEGTTRIPTLSHPGCIDVKSYHTPGTPSHIVSPRSIQEAIGTNSCEGYTLQTSFVDSGFRFVARHSEDRDLTMMILSLFSLFTLVFMILEFFLYPHCFLAIVLPAFKSHGHEGGEIDQRQLLCQFMPYPRLRE